jgi:cytochrome b6-f complex iron-sulfur subunit
MPLHQMKKDVKSQKWLTNKMKKIDSYKYKTRRPFLNILFWGSLTTVSASILYPMIRYLFPPRTTQVGPRSITAGYTDELAPNSGKVVRFGTKPVIVIKTPENEIRAFSAICTHLSCIVQYREDYQHIWCACHNGHFDLNGKNIAGPPPRPLEPFNVNIRGDEIIVTKV